MQYGILNKNNILTGIHEPDAPLFISYRIRPIASNTPQVGSGGNTPDPLVNGETYNVFVEITPATYGTMECTLETGADNIVSGIEIWLDFATKLNVLNSLAKSKGIVDGTAAYFALRDFLASFYFDIEEELARYTYELLPLSYLRLSDNSKTILDSNVLTHLRTSLPVEITGQMIDGVDVQSYTSDGESIKFFQKKPDNVSTKLVAGALFRGIVEIPSTAINSPIGYAMVSKRDQEPSDHGSLYPFVNKELDRNVY